jgi:cytochrome c-type biogenesis protein CcmE
MKSSPQALRIVLASAVIVAAIVWLAVSGYEPNKTYYVTIPELAGMGQKAYKAHLRVEGFVLPGSIQQNGVHASFVLNEYESHTEKAAAGRTLRVTYTGADPLPDTFKDDAQALAEGSYGQDGVFRATAIQAKCASKYESAQKPATTGSAPASAQKPASNRP